MKRFLLLISVLFVMSGCAGYVPADPNASQKEFTFDYSVTGKSQSDLWRNARDFFAETYGDSRSVFRIMDEKDGTIIGQGLASWNLVDPLGIALNKCHISYHVRFAAKEQKARLQFELIEGVPPLSDCKGWPWPSKDGLVQIETSFKNIANNLEHALNGHGTSSKLKNF